MSKERKFPPLIISPSSLVDKNQPLLAPDIADATAAPAAASTTGFRGLYSEFILTPRTGPSLPPIQGLKASPLSATFKKPSPLKPITGNYISTERNYKAVSDVDAKIKKVELDYHRALEPKVQLPFETKPGETPRKIEIERKKRLFSNQNNKLLIENEITVSFGGKDRSAYAQMLPLEVFDNTEFESRTIDEWLDLKVSEAKSIDVDEWVDTSAPKHVRHAKIPIPALALRRNVWLSCLVTAYDSMLQLWKVQWTKNSGWQLEYDQDLDESNFDLSDDGSQSQGLIGDTANKKIAWLHRLRILFLAEDPFQFAKRIASAEASREDAANRLVIFLFNSLEI